MIPIGQFLNSWNRCNPWLASCFVIFLSPIFLPVLRVLRGRVGILANSATYFGPSALSSRVANSSTSSASRMTSFDSKSRWMARLWAFIFKAPTPIAP